MTTSTSTSFENGRWSSMVFCLCHQRWGWVSQVRNACESRGAPGGTLNYSVALGVFLELAVCRVEVSPTATVPVGFRVSCVAVHMNATVSLQRTFIGRATPATGFVCTTMPSGLTALPNMLAGSTSGYDVVITTRCHSALVGAQQS